MNQSDDQQQTGAGGEAADEPESFEEKFAALEEIVDRMEREELPLEELLDQFERGVKYLRECSDFLEDARMRVEEYVEMTDEGPRIRDITEDVTDGAGESGDGAD